MSKSEGKNGLKNLPIGIQTFEKLRESDSVYVDKTRYILELIQSGSVYFLSRPRRFGKSLLISTLEAIFLGKRALFKGLYIDQVDYDWKTHPVIRIDMSQLGKVSPENIKLGLIDQLKEIADRYEIDLSLDSEPHIIFRHLISELSKTGKVVILIDEYDKPILDYITDVKTANINRDILRNFYTVIKAQDANVRFVLLTGVTKFAKVSVFSGLNNLKDLTMTTQAAALCGYTQEELESNFREYIQRLAEAEAKSVEETLEKIKFWYNGYQFSSNENSRVYNPFSTLLLFDNKEFKTHWFETGTPTFLIDLIQSEKLNLQDLERNEVPDMAFLSFDIERLESLPLLVQSGYLTIKHYDRDTTLYMLDYPNYEVKSAFIGRLSDSFSHLRQGEGVSFGFKLGQALKSKSLETFFEILEIFFANIPYDLHIKQEKYYHSVFYLIFTILGFTIQSEVKTNKGRIDAVVETKTDLFLFEFKFNDTAQAALDQIKTMDYFKKYLNGPKPVTLIGVSFIPEKRGLMEWVTE